MKRPRIIIDVVHPADVNFFKNAVNILRQKNIDIDVITRQRNILTALIEHEWQLPYRVFGKHRRSVVGNICHVITRDLALLWYLRKRDFDVAMSHGSLYLEHVCKLLNKPCIIFSDDIEFKLNQYNHRFFATRRVMPKATKAKSRNTVYYKGFKELAYLHPNYFKPRKEVLRKYGLKPNKYIFIRDVAKTINYRHLCGNEASSTLAYLQHTGLAIVVSLENKSKAKDYNGCIILREPVGDIYSLLYYAKLVVSSGDTVAREAGLLGTPVIYTGGRDMAVNRELQSLGCLIKVDTPEELQQALNMVSTHNYKEQCRLVILMGMCHLWDDTTEVILDNVLRYC